MPLSEQEQRLLEEMERSLYHSDADVVSTIGGRRGKPNYTVVVVGILIALLGVAAIVTGVIIRQPVVGVIGFGVMFVGVLLAISPPRRAGSATEQGHGRAAPANSTFMDRLNHRWDKRQGGHE